MPRMQQQHLRPEESSGKPIDKAAAKAPSSAASNSAPDGLPWERRRWAVAAIFTALTMASLDTAIANIALPAISSDLHVSPAEAIWVVNVYQIALVATLLPLGALGEIVGHERIYLGGLLLFTVASLGCCLGMVATHSTRSPDLAGPRRQRDHEREYRAGPLRLSKPAARPRIRPQRAGGRHRLYPRPDHRLRHPGARTLALAVRSQYSLRPAR